MAAWLRNRTDVIWTVLVACAGFALYACTAAPSVLMADAGEFQFVPYIAGITHPTGYPLYTMLGWVWSHIVTVGNVAYRMNLFSALWGGITAGITYQVALWSLRLTAPECPPVWRRVLSILPAVLLAVSGTFWSQAIIAEVYGLNSAFIAAILYLALRLWASTTNDDGQTERWFALLALVCGLSLTHHRTIVLLFPALALFVWYVTRRARFPWSRAIPVLLAALLLPQLLYLYIPLRAPHAPYVDIQIAPSHTLVLYEKSVGGFLDLVMAGAFGGQLGEGPVTSDRLVMAIDLLARQFTWVGVGLGVIGVLASLRRRAWPFVILTAVPYLTYVVFNLLYFIGDIYVLFIPTYQIWVLWVGLAVWELARFISGVPAGRAARRAWAGALLVLLSLALPLYVFAGTLPAVNQRSNREAERFWQPILAQDLPEDAVLVSNDRDEIMPMWYFQYIDGLQPGWLGMFPLIVREPGYQDVTQVIDRALDSGRPVFLVKPMPGLELKYRLGTSGPVVRIIAPHGLQPPQHALAASFDDVVRLTGYDVSYPTPDTLEIVLFWSADQPMTTEFSSYVHLVDDAGQTVVTDDHQLGGAYYPTTAWKPGETLQDAHVLQVPAKATGEYALTAGLYAWPSMARLGQEVEIGTVTLGE